MNLGEVVQSGRRWNSSRSRSTPSSVTLSDLRYERSSLRGERRQGPVCRQDHRGRQRRGGNWQGPHRDRRASRVRFDLPGGLPAEVTRVSDAGRFRIVETRCGGHMVKLLVKEGDTVPEGQTHLVFDPAHTQIYEDGWIAGLNHEQDGQQPRLVAGPARLRHGGLQRPHSIDDGGELFGAETFGTTSSSGPARRGSSNCFMTTSSSIHCSARSSSPRPCW